MARPLHEIADEIFADWKRPYFGAVPYLDAMAAMDSIHENYVYSPGITIVRYFLVNAGTWRGETARRIKAELKGML